ncbi:hypothetical protein BGZ63DRAFT_368840 [Mariannaea sp. PMI_226]|nr:hypothetical protein BGZ63DRAFT_368840 [Mariannaea sp. PMI_226]
MATIKQIDGRTIHQIQSGQVIVDLCSVVKELIENSIDAEATSIDVRFKNQGLDLIEVQDNGSGVSPNNYASMALKHHTSKLSSYSDIAALQTFGFRGEALASLCALSVLSVTTCQSSEVPRGAKLSFESSGKLKTTSITAAQKGTTVSVEKLFHNLPVRRRELERNIKREWHKVIALLNQYACIQTNLKFSVSQQPTKGKRMHLFSTRGNQSTRENIINIFGAKTLVALVPLHLKLELRPSTVNKGLQIAVKAASASREVHVVGHVSRPAHGEGRQTPDRQMFFVNGRPCGLPQFAKVFNNVYKSFNSSQNPFILADIRLDTDMYDVNVSPDKRSILLHDQNDLLETLRDSLTTLFDSHDYTVPTSQLMRSHNPEVTTSKPGPAIPKTSSRPPDSNNGSDSESQSDSQEDEEFESLADKVPPGRARTLGTSRSLIKDGRGQNLISRWVERAASNQHVNEKRPVSLTQDADMSLTQKPTGCFSKSVVEGVSTEALSESSQSEDEDKSRPVKDFNKRLAEFSSASRGTVKRASIPSSPLTDEALNSDEHQVPAIQPLSLAQAGSEAGNYSSNSNKWNVPQPVVVAVGDHGTIDPCYPPEISCKDATLSGSADILMPATHPTTSFGSRLSQLYSADPNQKQVEDSITDEIPLVDGNGNGDESPGKSSHAFNEQSADEHQGRSRTEDEVTVQATSIFQFTARRHTTTHVSSPSTDSTEEITAERVAQEEARIRNSDDQRGPVPVEPREQFLKSGARKKDATYQAMQYIQITEEALRLQSASWTKIVPNTISQEADEGITDLSAIDAEEKLSLTISKGDFGRMRVAGQFNLGFIIAVRPATRDKESNLETPKNDELFIIDQHATDEKYNFERLQASTVVQSQRLVHPKRLELTALEEEIVMENLEAIEANGFKIEVDSSGKEHVGSRCQVLALPLSREITFGLKDLEELISLLGEESSESRHIPRPSKVRKMFAMRACRSSVMIGKPLTQGQMEVLVRHMGNLNKPWNCPHGRPTMRHLCKLQSWDSKRWNGDMRRDSVRLWHTFAEGN